MYGKEAVASMQSEHSAYTILKPTYATTVGARKNTNTCMGFKQHTWFFRLSVQVGLAHVVISSLFSLAGPFP